MDEKHSQEGLGLGRSAATEQKEAAVDVHASNMPPSALNYYDPIGTLQGGGNNPYVNFSAHLYTDPWEKDRDNAKVKGQPLYKSFWGRVGTRMFSRGLVGASFMTLGNLALNTWDTYLPMEEQMPVHKALTRMAEFFDGTAGKGLASVSTGWHTMLGRADAKERGQALVSGFRSKKQFSMHRIEETVKDISESNPLVTRPIGELTGRTLGQEMVGMTFDFALGSFGDALGREIVSLFDPNYRKEWIKEDGSVDVGKMVTGAGRSLWRMVSYNQMEDWAAALPYVYQCRFQRNFIAKHFKKDFPNSKLMLDNQSGAYKLDKDTNEIIGTYMWPSALDLQFRFMGYNFYTLMFRDAYNHMAGMYHNWKDHGFGIHFEMPEHPVEQCEHAFSESVKYVAKSFIKSMTYMAPAVPFFWAFRTPIQMSRGIFISGADDRGAATTVRTQGVEGAKGNREYVARYKPQRGARQYVATAGSSDFMNVMLMKNPSKGIQWKDNENFIRAPERLGENAEIESLCPTFGERLLIGDKRPLWFHKDFNPRDEKYYASTFDKFLYPFAQIGHKAGEVLASKLFHPIGESKWMTEFVEKTPSLQEALKRYPNTLNSYNVGTTFAHSALSYTPYMIAKYETANHIDMPLFDAATYRMLDGIHHLSGKDFKEGIHDMASVLVRGSISEGTVAAASKPRGLVNSSYEMAHKKEEKQKELKEKRDEYQHKQYVGTTPKQAGGWAAYEAMRSQGNEKGAPDGVTIH